MSKQYAVILAGGKGERFWPLSTSKRPKQLLSLVGDKPLITQSVNRLQGLIPIEQVLILTNDDLVEATREAVPNLPPENVVGEPVGRDTAPAVALACALVKHRDPDAVFCILTADHIIHNLDVFQQTLQDGMDQAENSDWIITIGIQPSFPSTGFGYIHAGQKHKTMTSTQFRRAEKFVEKPDQATAEQYLNSGEYFWNSGMFIWSVKTIEANLRAHTESLGPLIDQVVEMLEKGTFDQDLMSVFEPLEKISIDYAVMEKSDKILTAVGTFAWSDVGAWPALAEHFDPDSAGNTSIGDVCVLDSSGNITVSNDRLTCLLGVDDLVVVQAENTTLVCKKDKAQDIKKLLGIVRENPEWLDRI